MLPAPKACVGLFRRRAVWSSRGIKLKIPALQWRVIRTQRNYLVRASVVAKDKRRATVCVHGHSSSKRKALLSTPAAWWQGGMSDMSWLLPLYSSHRLWLTLVSKLITSQPAWRPHCVFAHSGSSQVMFNLDIATMASVLCNCSDYATPQCCPLVLFSLPFSMYRRWILGRHQRVHPWAPQLPPTAQNSSCTSLPFQVDLVLNTYLAQFP